jgi:glucose/arabinose dehydrogenase
MHNHRIGFLVKHVQVCLAVCLTAVVVGGSPKAFAVTDQVVVSGLDRPWAVVSGPDGNIWISEKTGSIKIFSPTFKLLRTLSGFPDLVVTGEGGVLDIAFHPLFKNNNWIYVAYSVADATGHHTRINRFTFVSNSLQEHKIIFDGPSSNAGTHFGARLVFDAQGFLFASFGERREMYKAQDLNLSHGKIVRVKDDGSVPVDNPFGASNAVFTYGHRNPQGLAIHPVSQKMYDSEHGPTVYDAPAGGDEINEIVRGTNYGWPDYHHQMTGPNVQSPLLEYTPAVAPSGIAFYTGTKIPGWTNDLFVACLRGQKLLRIHFDSSGRVASQQSLLATKYGRLRDVDTSPDGSLLVISEGGKLIQLK